MTPLKVSKLKIEQFIYKHKVWIQEKVSIASAAAANGKHHYYLSNLFSYCIAMLPKHIIQYIVAHELMHLKYHSHSLAFWVYVEQLYPY